MTTVNHPFIERPHRTLVALSIPVLFSLTAEPLTALIDTAFIASLGAVPLAALGVGTTALSSTFWIFNFLGIGAQTEVAQADGQGKRARAGRIAGLAHLLAAGFGVLLIGLLLPTAVPLARLLGAEGAVLDAAVAYMRVRLFGAPAVLLLLTSFGALRGLQDMRTPLWVALGLNGVNILLDWLLIFGIGPFPVLGVAGSAWASTIAQWLGALAALALLQRRIELRHRYRPAEAANLLRVGGDLFIRTGMLTFFLALTTRAATRSGAEAGAAHQAIRQVYVFTALALDAFSATVQSLVGFFFGSGALRWARRVVVVGLWWSLGTGLVLGILMWLGRGLVIDLLVPETAVAVFLPAWAVSAVGQPFNSFAFLTDGVHWGTGDYRFLRNGMLAATATAVLLVWLIPPEHPGALTWIWAATFVWVIIRGVVGLLRVYPGIGNSPWRQPPF